mmetsp:Transcript_9556/g.20665  ORF Transcript_9556/g.20665 Transcript_9556/m.20665 type:complete len:510 (+) Transcript_9556:277-1806(+)
MKKGNGKGNPRSCNSGFTSVTVIDTDCFATPGHQRKKCFAASIEDGETGKIYHVNRDGEVTESDSSEYPEEEHPPNEDEPFENYSERRSLRGESQNERSLLATPVIDILVIYTQGAKRDAQNHNHGPIQDLVNLAVAQTNEAYVNSGINAELRLAHLHEDTSGYTADEGSTSMRPPLYQLTYKHGHERVPDGLLEYAHQMREDKGADMVALITTGAGCGIGWISGNCATCNPDKNWMFSVTKYSCATGQYSFAHELGHNMGCNHDKGTTGRCGTSNYRYGYRDPNSQYGSILSYPCKSGQCDEHPGGSCTRAKFFSTPDPNYLWNGRPMGRPRGHSLGETNNAKTINDRAEHISNFYESAEPAPPPTPNPTSNPTEPQPSSNPTSNPTNTPTKQPTSNPTDNPTEPQPSPSPTLNPSSPPSKQPTSTPTKKPKVWPNGFKKKHGAISFYFNLRYSYLVSSPFTLYPPLRTDTVPCTPKFGTCPAAGSGGICCNSNNSCWTSGKNSGKCK